MPNNSKTLSSARKNKNDEFYTRLVDIEKECAYYKDFFKGKKVYCNCDDPIKSKFYKYFCDNFKELGIKRVEANGYVIGEENKKPIYGIYAGEINIVVCVEKDIDTGDFRSEGSVNILKNADVVVTNIPFSQCRDFIRLMNEYDKKFLIIANINALTYKEVFPLIKDNKLWLGVTGFNEGMYFNIPDDYEYADTYKFKKEIDGERVMRVPGVCWLTNIDNPKRNTPIELTRKFDESYKKYDNYDAIEVSKTKDIPIDYQGVMGVPITFLDKYCPDQFEIVGLTANWDESDEMKMIKTDDKNRNRGLIDGKTMYARVLIKHKS